MTILADLTVNTETMVVIAAVVSSLVTAIVFLFKTLHAQMKEERDTWRKIADEAVANLEEVVNAKRKKEGLPPIEVVAAIVPEHSSPVKRHQKEAAELQTMRARLTAAALSAGLEPRTIKEPE